MKTNKSYSKRLKVTKNGKIIARKPGQNHFNAKEDNRKSLDKRSTKQINMTSKAQARFLSK